MLPDTFLSKDELTSWLASLASGPADVYPPVIEDLYSLYIQIRELGVVSILELGSGFSTSVLALALHQNKKEFGPSYLAAINHPNPFELLTIDASGFWLDIALSRLPLDLEVNVISHVTDSFTSLYNDQICTFFKDLPYFSADFIYLDGPDPGQSRVLEKDSQTLGAPPMPMSADLLRLENLLWPGTRICVDGRGANARFLQNNFIRGWKYSYLVDLDQHIFDLSEDCWGSLNQKHQDFKEFRNSPSRFALRK
jgi:hypothetical protein